MAMEFVYREATTPNGRRVMRPLIPITLSCGDQNIDALGLLDSGADITLLDRVLAENLGMDLTGKTIEARSLTGRLKVVRVVANLGLDDGMESHRLAIPALVNMESTSEVMVVLGRAGLFKHFTISFIESSHSILLERHIPIGSGSVAIVEQNKYLRSHAQIDIAMEKTAAFGN